MIEFYEQVRLVHVIAVIASGSLFFLRGLLVQAARPDWALAAVPRYLSYAIDTALLTAAVLLVTMLPRAAFANGWLAVKLTLLPVYIGLGWGALRARTPGRRLGSFIGALAAFAGMFTIARAHNPLGLLATLLRG